MAERHIVQFTPLSSLVQPAFWHSLTNLKIDVLKLSQDELPITASYTAGRVVIDRETGKDVALGCNLTLAENAFDKDIQMPPHSVKCTGVFKNYNTIEEFKAADKTALFNQLADEMWSSITRTEDDADVSELLNQFLLLTFADLKKYRYYYWFAFPAFAAKPAWDIDQVGWQSADDVLGTSALEAIHKDIHDSPSPLPYFVVKPALNNPSTYEVLPLSSLSSLSPSASQAITIGFLDPSALPEHPGWPLRNLLTFLRLRFRSLFLDSNSQEVKVKVLCWRDAELPGSGKAWRSRSGVVTVSEGPATVVEGNSGPGQRPSAVGWEKNPQGKLAPRLADLAPMMDPARLADQAVDLNLKLMRWRILPSLDLEKVAATRCLLLGAGTLGCYVARTLLAWGVRNITFVDSAVVSFSNPVRQPLFEFEDCLNGGKPKAQCAADHLKRVFPGVNARGISMSIPMPGHPIPPASIEQTKADVSLLETLIDEHDTVFLLMDSRESRWLPTVICAAKGKIVMNTALGFDSYLVMRHGGRSSPRQLGCYYCNDVVAPADSLTDRTLDQMCTVTRPGLASIASATAVELLVSVLQHPEGVNAPAPPADLKDRDDGDEAAPYKSVLGLVPHQLRGFLAQFRTLPIVGAAYDRCTGCSETVLKAYETQGFDMLLHAFNEPEYLEKLTGLDKLHDEGEAALEAVEWDEEDDEL